VITPITTAPVEFRGFRRHPMWKPTYGVPMRLSRRQMLIAGGAAVVALAVFAGLGALLLGRGDGSAGRSWHAAPSTSSASSSASSPSASALPFVEESPVDPSGVDPTAPATLFLGSTLSADNPDRLRLAAGRTVILRDATSLLHVTPGPLTPGTGACSGAPFLTVTLTVEALAGSATVGPEAFRLRTAGGDIAPLAACTVGFSRAALLAGQTRKAKLAFAGTARGRLVFGPDPAKPTAVWQLK
jgi:hypothetical protein